MTETIAGPMCTGRNWSISSGAGSIHDDDTASKLGFRGGTVGGDIHMNQFASLLVQIFGDAWFERGHLSLDFKNATVDQEKVQAFAEVPADGQKQVRVWMEREDGLLVCQGTGGIDDHSKTELRSKDMRPCDPTELRILRQFEPGMSLGTYQMDASSAGQILKLDDGLLNDPLPCYRDSKWGLPVSSPSSVMQTMFSYVMQGITPRAIESSTGLFGAIEFCIHNGPYLLDQPYRLECEVVCVSQSPKTEILWYDCHAYNQAGDHVITMRVQSRTMKAASSLYQ
ncbi:MAG: hypothetical protein AAF525_17480 [Pseudomonadota bacterium]